jgi:hypothetical protein
MLQSRALNTVVTEISEEFAEKEAGSPMRSDPFTPQLMLWSAGHSTDVSVNSVSPL